MYSRHFRQNVSLMLILSLLFSLFGNTVFAMDADVNTIGNEGVKMNAGSTFPDLQDSYAKQEIEALVQKGILSGFEDGSFKPHDSVTRAQLAKLLVLSLGMQEDPDASARFKDVAPNSWYRGFVGALVKSGITDGTSSETFSPDDQVSREQLAVFFIRAFGLEEWAKQLQPDAPLADMQEISDWARPHVSFAFKIGFLQGVQNADGMLRFAPKQFAERQALARLTYEFSTHSQKYTDEAKKQVSELLQAAVRAANDAIAALPSLNSLTKDKAMDVQEARAKVEAAKKLGAVDSDFPELKKLTDSEKKIADLNQNTPSFGGGGGGGGGGSVNPPVTPAGPQVLSSIEAGTHTGDVKVANGVSTFGPNTGLAEINGTLTVDPGPTGELTLQNIKATKIVVLSGADHSITFSQTMQAGSLIVAAVSQQNPVRIVASSQTIVGTTVVGSQAILNSVEGSLGDINIDGTAAGKQVSLEGTFSGNITVAASGATLSVGQSTVVSQVYVATGATINSRGTISTLAMTSAAAGGQLNLIGSFSSTIVSVAASGATLNVAQDTTVSQVSVQSGATISSNGTIGALTMTSAAAGGQLNLVGSFSSTVVSVAAEGARINVAQNTSVSQLHVSSAASINSNGTIHEVSADTASQIILTGSFVSSTINVTVDGSKLVITQSTVVSTIRVSQNVTNASIVTDGTITSIESSTQVVIDLSGSKKDEIVQNAIKAAHDAIAALPRLDQLTITDVSSVTAARNKVSAVTALHADIESGDKVILEAAEAKIAVFIQAKNEAVQTAITAIDGLPATVGFGSKSAVEAARALVSEALAKGAVNAEITNLNKLVQAELTMTQLIAAKNEAVQAAISAIHVLPATITLSDKSRVEAARQLVNTAISKGATEAEITNLSVLSGAEAVVAQLLTQQAAEKNAAVQAAIQAIGALPSTLRLGDEQKVIDARTSVSAAQGKGADLSEITNLDKLTAAEGKIAALKADKTAPGLLSATATIGGNDYPGVLNGSTMKFTIPANAQNTAMFTGFVIHADSDADKLTVSEAGITKDIPFQNGTANATVSQILGSLDPQGDGVSVGILRMLMGSSSFSITAVLTDLAGNTSSITLQITDASRQDAIAQAIAAIDALPAADVITLSDKTKVTSAQSLVDAAKAKGAVDTDIANLSKLTAVQSKIAELQAALEAKQAAIAQAIAAIDAVPAADVITLSEIDKDKVANAKALVADAKAKGAVETDITNVSKLTAVQAKLDELQAAFDAKQAAIAQAIAAIEAVPAADVITLSDIDKGKVATAKALVVNAKTKGAADADITNLTKLTAAQAKLDELQGAFDAKQAAIAQAIAAIEAVPAADVITLSDNDKGKVANAKALVAEAKTKGAADSDITNLSKLTAAQAKLDELQAALDAKQAAIAQAIVAIDTVPAADVITLSEIDKGKVANAKALVADAKAKGAVDTDFTNLSKLTAAQAKLDELQAAFDAKQVAIAQAIAAIDAVPAAGVITLSEIDKGKVANAKALVADAKTKGAVDADITNLPKLTAAQAKLDELQAALDAKQAAIAQAIAAIEAVPAADVITLSEIDKGKVANAQALVAEAKLKGTVDADITNLSKLTAAQTRIAELEAALAAKNAAIAAAYEAINKLPPVITISQQTQVEAARALVTDAKAKGAIDSDITNLSVLIAAEAVIAELLAPPVFKSASATIGGANIPAAVSADGSMITFSISSALSDTSMVTGFTINASSDVKDLVVTFMGLSRTVPFTNGTAVATVSQLLGSAFDPQGDGVSVGVLRGILADGALSVPGALTDLSGHSTNVVLKLAKTPGVSAPVLTAASATIGNQSVPAVISQGNFITFTLSDSLPGSAMITGFRIESGDRASKLTFAPGGVTKSVYFAGGMANMAVADLLGSLDPQGNGVSVGALRQVMGNQNLTLTGMLLDTDGNSSVVTLTILLTTDTGAPTITSASATVNGDEVPATVGPNAGQITFVMSKMFSDTDMVTRFTIYASADAYELTLTSNGLTRTIPFQNGTARMSVAQLLGSSFDPQGNGVSVGLLKQQMKGSNVVVTGQLKDQSGLVSNVTVIVAQPLDTEAPSISAGAAVIAGNTIAAVVHPGNELGFTLPNALKDSDMFTGITIKASSDAYRLAITASNTTKLIYFMNGSANVTVSELLGRAIDTQGDGVSIGMLRSLILGDKLMVTGKLTDLSGNESTVTLTLEKELDITPPAIETVSATIGGSSYPGVVTADNKITFTVSEMLKNTAMFTGLTVKASADTDKLTMSDSELSRTVAFTDGNANISVSDLLGKLLDPQGDGVSVGTLRSLIADGKMSISGTLTDRAGNTAPVTLEIVIAKDMEAPVVTALNPAPGYIGTTVNLKATATDKVGVVTFKFEYALNLENGVWNKIAELAVQGEPAVADVTYAWNTSDLPDGPYFVRGVAIDAAGNVSTATPVNQYLIDRTAPDAPGGFSLTATSADITLTWQQGSEYATYQVFRATSEDGPYTLLVGGLAALGYQDVNVNQDVTYYYKVQAVDRAGNVSPATEIKFASLLPDKEVPIVRSFGWTNGVTLPANPSIRVLASDNYRLSEIKLEYQDTSGVWIEIGTKSGINLQYDSPEFVWNTTGLSDGALYTLRATAKDMSGNISDVKEVSYKLNLAPPAAPVLTVTPHGWQNELSWTSGNEDDLAGFIIKRSTVPGGPYDWSKQVVKGTTTYLDEHLSPQSTYYYVVQAIDQYRNVSDSNPGNARPLPNDPYPPTADAGLEKQRVAIVNTDVQFDGTLSSDHEGLIASYHWDFGDGQSSALAAPKHSFAAVGNYTVTLAVYDQYNNSAKDVVTVQVVEPSQEGTVEITALDARGNKLDGALVSIVMSNGDIRKDWTRGGKTTLVVPPGEYTVYVYSSDYMPSSTKVTVELNKTVSTQVSLQDGKVLFGELHVDRMSPDQVVAAGIDINAPENQWVYKFEVHLAFNDQPLPQPQQFYANSAGQLFGIGGGEPAPFVISAGTGGPGGDSGATLLAYPKIIPSTHPEIKPTVAYMIIPGEARWLKEFFDVTLLLQNKADANSPFVITDSKATLVLPDGLTMVPSTYSKSLTLDVEDIAGQEEKKVKWIVRGDKEGVYSAENNNGMSATFQGTLKPFNEKITAKFKPDKPIKVWGGNAMTMSIDAQDRADAGSPYHVTFTLKNVTNSDSQNSTKIYNLTFELKEEGKLNYIYMPGSQLKQFIPVLEPGQSVSFDYWLIPQISGDLDLSQSFVVQSGGNTSIPATFSHHSEPWNQPGNAPVMKEQIHADGTAYAQWGQVPDAQGYNVYEVHMDELGHVVSDLLASLNGLADSFTTIMSALDALNKHLMVTTIVNGKEQLRHSVPFYGLEKTAAPTVTGTVYDESDIIQVTAEAGAKVTFMVKGVPTQVQTDSNGAYSLHIPSYWNLEAGDILYVTALSAHKTVSDTVTITVYAAPLTGRPTVDQRVDTETSFISGTAEAGAFVTFDYKDQTTFVQADPNGNYMLNIPSNWSLEAGDTLIVTALARYKKVSDTVTVSVYLAPPTVLPTVDQQVVDTETTSITGKTLTGAMITVKDAKGNVIGTNNSWTDSNNGYSIGFNRKLVAGETLTVTAKVVGKSVSEAVTIVVSQAPVTAAPTVIGKIYEQDGSYYYPQVYLTGTKEAGSLVAIKDDKGHSTSESYYYDYGQSYRLYLPTDWVLNTGDVLEVTAKANGKTVSETVQVNVYALQGKTEAPTVTGSVYKVSEFFYSNLSGIAEPGSTVYLKYADGTSTPAIANNQGLFSFTLDNSRIAVDGQLELRAQTYGKSYSDTVTTTVLAAPPADRPTVTDNVYEQDGTNNYQQVYIHGQVERYAIVTLRKDAYNAYNGYADYYGAYSIYVPSWWTLKAGDRLNVTSNVSGKTVSDPSVITVKALEGQTAAPTVTGNVYKTNQDSYIYIKGTAEPGSVVVAKFSGGTVASATADSLGNYMISAYIYNGYTTIQVGETVVVTAQKYGKSYSTAWNGTVEAAPLTAVPTVTGTVYEQTGIYYYNYFDGNYYYLAGSIQGTTEPFAAVYLTKDDGSYMNSSNADETGQYTLQVPYWLTLTAGETLKVSAKTAWKSTSDSVSFNVNTLQGQTSQPTVTGSVYKSSDNYYDFVQIKGKSEPGALILLTAGQTTYPKVADLNGNYSISVYNGYISVGDQLVISAQSYGKTTSEPLTVSVLQAPPTAAPTVTGDVYEQTGNYDWAMPTGYLTGTAVQGATVTLTTYSGTSIADTTAYDGSFTLELPYWVALQAGDFLKLTARANGYSNSEPVMITVKALTDKTAAPTVTGNVYKSSDYYYYYVNINGTSEPNSKVTLKNGQDTYSTKSDSAGYYSFDIYNGSLTVGEQLEITAQSYGKMPSDSLMVPVLEAPPTASPTVTGDVYEQDGNGNWYDPRGYLNGTAEAGATVTLSTDSGAYIADATAYYGSYTLELPYWVSMKAGDTLKLTARIYGYSDSAPVLITVKAVTDKTAAPTVTGNVYKTSNYTDVTLYGHTEPNSVVTVKYQNGSTNNAYADSEGNFWYYVNYWSISVGDQLELTAKSYGKSVSDPLKVTVLKAPPTAMPTVTGMVYETVSGYYELNSIHGTTESGAKVIVKDASGDYDYNYADQNGAYYLSVPSNWNLKAGDVLYITAQSYLKSESDAVSVQVLPLQGETQAPTVTSNVYATEATFPSYIEGTAESNASILVKYPEGENNTYSDYSGYFRLNTEYMNLKAGDQLVITAKGYGKNVSSAVYATVAALQGQTAAPIVTGSVYATVQGYQETIEGTSVPGSTVLATFPSGESSSMLTGSDGKFYLYTPYYSSLNQGDVVMVSAKENSKLASQPVSLIVLPLQGKTGTPTVTGQVYAADMVTGTAEPGAIVRIQAQEYWQYTTGVAGLDGTYSIELPEWWSLSPGASLLVSAKAASKLPSDALLVTVSPTIGQTELPTVTGSVYAGDAEIRGAAEPNAWVYLTSGKQGGQNGNGFDTRSKADSNGSYSLYVPKENLQAGDVLYISAKAVGKAHSDLVTITVQTTNGVSQAPTVSQAVYEGLLWVTGTAEAGSLVTVKTNGMELTNVSADNQGIYNVMSYYTNVTAGEVLSITAKAAGKAESNPVNIPVIKTVISTSAPTVTGNVYQGAMSITGSAEPSALVFATLGNTLYTASASANGSFTFTFNGGLTSGQTVGLKALTYGKALSGVTTVYVQSAPISVARSVYGFYPTVTPSMANGVAGSAAVASAVYANTVTNSVYAGQSFTLTVTVKDANNNPITKLPTSAFSVQGADLMAVSETGNGNYSLTVQINTPGTANVKVTALQVLSNTLSINVVNRISHVAS
ncbi:Ig-like domain-containing protein [Paenibacillus cremeus]|uniref:Ig-like domain-containing protein n=1 Tax=Paenibacillus cremeus TaxID=2163881 RepID=UPI0016448789|nr:Ig-like domain-containing protein [Paenibacillus cremeus]